MQHGQTRPELPAPAWLEAGALRLERRSGRVTVRGRELALTDMEARVLQQLLLHRGTPLSRTEMLERLYAEDPPEARVVDVFICRLRAKLAAAGLYHVIGTVWRRGYLLQLPSDPPREPWVSDLAALATGRPPASPAPMDGPRAGMLMVA